MAGNRRTNRQYPAAGQRSIFDLPGMEDALADELPVHPSIADFAIHIDHQHDDKTEPADPLLMKAEADRSEAEPLLMISFGSGSSGNCTYIGTRREGILIDAGVDSKTVIETLKANGIRQEAIRGICLTHDHSDHVRYVYSFVRRRPEVAIFCTPKTLGGLLRRHSISRRIKDYHHPIYKEFAFSVAGMEVTAFDVSHDGTDNCGYFISRGPHAMTIATDLGVVTDRVDYYMRQANYAIIEANYDARMLATGPYPQYLKARIAAERGHLDNEDTARFLASIISPRLSHIFLCHLSQDNNTPEKAVEAVATQLRLAGITAIGDCSESESDRTSAVHLMALPRLTASRLFLFRAPED